MLHILVDGYNLIGTAHENLQKARHGLVQNLLSYSRAKGYQVTVVFDGWKDGQIKEARIRTDTVTVIYSKLGEKADDVIKKLIQSSRPPLIVVSSDRELADFAWGKDIVALNADEFERKVHSTLNPEERAIDDDHTGTSSVRRNGNRRRLSSREKKKMQALNKL